MNLLQRAAIMSMKSMVMLLCITLWQLTATCNDIKYLSPLGNALCTDSGMYTLIYSVLWFKLIGNIFSNNLLETWVPHEFFGCLLPVLGTFGERKISLVNSYTVHRLLKDSLKGADSKSSLDARCNFYSRGWSMFDLFITSGENIPYFFFNKDEVDHFHAIYIYSWSTTMFHFL